MDLLDRVRATGLLPAGAPVVVLLSGGRDSVCLLDVAERLAGSEAVTVLHVNYGLRDAADEDEAFCRELCVRLGVALDVETVARPPETGNLQAWARDIRLGAGTRLALARGAQLATGHTASDQAETVLYRLAASPGRRALLGMSERDGLLVRPLLRVTREETAEHDRARGIAWREDASNDDSSFARNRARADLVPALRTLHPSAERNVVRTAQLLRDEALVLDEVVETALGGRDQIAVTQLGALPVALARLVVRRLAEDVVGGLCARAPSRLGEILELGDGALDLGDGARAVVSGGVLRVEPTPPGRSAPTSAGQPQPRS
ncbi:MAG TPA: tRNA lysidine(34) synthetase TilS [Solirubrobacteraceae bacterium]|jgi:tRNA(Ile)-lysidine synthase|nr:tRNA lysidine(34) synthetase TilS [Solirubrobacteraceae bacterium]